MLSTNSSIYFSNVEADDCYWGLFLYLKVQLQGNGFNIKNIIWYYMILKIATHNREINISEEYSKNRIF